MLFFKIQGVLDIWAAEISAMVCASWVIYVVTHCSVLVCTGSAAAGRGTHGGK